MRIEDRGDPTEMRIRNDVVHAEIDVYIDVHAADRCDCIVKDRLPET